MKIHVTRFQTGTRQDKVIDMTPDGQFIDRPPEVPSDKLLRFAAVAAVVLGMAAVAALALWVAMALIPLAIVAGLVAYAAFRWQQWRVGRSAGGEVSPRPPFGQ